MDPVLNYTFDNTNYTLDLQRAQVIQQNIDGTYEIVTDGSPFPISRVSSAVHDIPPGKRVTIMFENRDRSQARIIDLDDNPEAEVSNIGLPTFSGWPMPRQSQGLNVSNQDSGNAGQLDDVFSGGFSDSFVMGIQTSGLVSTLSVGIRLNDALDTQSLNQPQSGGGDNNPVHFLDFSQSPPVEFANPSITHAATYSLGYWIVPSSEVAEFAKHLDITHFHTDQCLVAVFANTRNPGLTEGPTPLMTAFIVVFDLDGTVIWESDLIDPRIFKGNTTRKSLHRGFYTCAWYAKGIVALYGYEIPSLPVQGDSDFPEIGNANYEIDGDPEAGIGYPLSTADPAVLQSFYDQLEINTRIDGYTIGSTDLLYRSYITDIIPNNINDTAAFPAVSPAVPRGTMISGTLSMGTSSPTFTNPIVTPPLQFNLTAPDNPNGFSGNGASGWIGGFRNWEYVWTTSGINGTAFGGVGYTLMTNYPLNSTQYLISHPRFNPLLGTTIFVPYRIVTESYVWNVGTIAGYTDFGDGSGLEPGGQERPLPDTGETPFASQFTILTTHILTSIDILTGKKAKDVYRSHAFTDREQSALLIGYLATEGPGSSAFFVPQPYNFLPSGYPSVPGTQGYATGISFQLLGWVGGRFADPDHPEVFGGGIPGGFYRGFRPDAIYEGVGSIANSTQMFFTDFYPYGTPDPTNDTGGVINHLNAIYSVSTSPDADGNPVLSIIPVIDPYLGSSQYGADIIACSDKYVIEVTYGSPPEEFLYIRDITQSLKIVKTIHGSIAWPDAVIGKIMGAILTSDLLVVAWQPDEIHSTHPTGIAAFDLLQVDTDGNNTFALKWQWRAGTHMADGWPINLFLFSLYNGIYFSHTSNSIMRLF